MKKIILISTAASALFAGAAFAQDGDTFVSTTDQVTAGSAFGDLDSANDAVDDLNDVVADDLASGSDSNRYASSAFAQGFQGSISAAANFASALDQDSTDASVGASFTYGSGVWNQSATIYANYVDIEGDAGEDDDTKFKWDASYDISRDLNPRTYVYGQLRGAQDAVNYNADNELKTTDFFGGVGLGYRIYAEENFAWRIQGAVGYRMIDDNLSDNRDEPAGIVESRLFWAANDAVSLTNDTSILYSETDTKTVNELGLNYSMGGPLSLRATIRIENNSDLFDTVDSLANDVTDLNLDNTSYTTGVALVYALN